jgi:hypothetical protein
LHIYVAVLRQMIDEFGNKLEKSSYSIVILQRLGLILGFVFDNSTEGAAESIEFSNNFFE